MAVLPLVFLCILALVLPGSVVGVTFHVNNKCPFPVWPAAAPNSGHPVIGDGGFFLPPGQSKRVMAPATWNGRIWGRTGCDFSATNAAGRCLTGDCGGHLVCNGSIGAPPATLVEVNLHEDESKGSSYDVSVVDGYNLPVAVWTRPANRSSKCFIAGCAKDMNALCPPELQVRTSGGGKGKTTVVACRSACLAFGLDAFCCRGAYGTAETCRGSVYSRMFRDACPGYYSYAYDQAAVAPRCYAPEYVVTFCPSRWGAAPDRVAQL
ncbi:thaumatin-like protein [Lolium perenne]|uniref:thaumatin-like protein n=1 Tax=Lolium perenne TaxID=4522 RepID=UPI0021EA9222|nr:thaumatin-like protein [Lolium perenne]